MSTTDTREAVVEVDKEVPIIRITRDFNATPIQLVKAHTDPELYARWVGPNRLAAEIDYWDARTGGSWRFMNTVNGQKHGFHGCFHEVSDHRIVQTFTWEEMPEGVSLETLTFEDLGDGRTRLHTQWLVGSFAARDQWLSNDMEVGVNERALLQPQGRHWDGYGELDTLFSEQNDRNEPTMKGSAS